MTASTLTHEGEVTTTTTQGVGGRPASGERRPEPKAPVAKAEPQPRYAEGTEELSAQVLAAREVHGRAKLAEFLGISQSACWRAEKNRIHPTEVAHLRDRMARIGELPAPEPKQSPGTRADLAARIETAVNLLGKSRGDKKVTKIALVDQVLAVLDPR